MINFFNNYLNQASEHSKRLSYDPLTKKLISQLDNRLFSSIKDGEYVLLTVPKDKKYLKVYSKLTEFINNKFVLLGLKRLRRGCMIGTYKSGNLIVYKLYGLGKEVYLIHSDDIKQLNFTLGSLGYFTSKLVK